MWIKHLSPHGEFYREVDENGKEIQSIPSYGVDKRWPALKEKLDSGDIVPTDFDAEADDLKITQQTERDWRDSRLRAMDIEYNIRRREGGDMAAVDAYAKELCDWPAHADFPDSTKRPTI